MFYSQLHPPTPPSHFVLCLVSMDDTPLLLKNEEESTRNQHAASREFNLLWKRVFLEVYEVVIVVIKNIRNPDTA